jgi:hypothetical protein
MILYGAVPVVITSGSWVIPNASASVLTIAAAGKRASDTACNREALPFDDEEPKR